MTALTTVTLNRPQAASRPDPVAATVPVALKAEGLPKDFSIGIVLTLGQSGEPGSEYNRAAQGASSPHSALPRVAPPSPL